MTNEELAIKQHLSKDRPNAAACGCMGPQRDEPLCPCAMNWVEVVDEKYYQVKEHRSPIGIYHSAECLGNVGDKFGIEACPPDKALCRNMERVKVRAYWEDFACNLCGHKVSLSRKK